MTDQFKNPLEFIEKILAHEIVAKDETMRGHKLVSCKAKNQSTLDGFMSVMFRIEMITQYNGVEQTHKMVIKMMKGSEHFRIATKSYIQFSNELYIYTVVIPYFKVMAESSISKTINVDNWIPHVYYGYYGKRSELSEMMETILALKDLSPEGYRLGPRLCLDDDHLAMMARSIGQYHAFSYALHIRKDPKHKELFNGLKPLPFVAQADKPDELNFYESCYNTPFRRIFDYYDRKIKDSSSYSDKFKEDVEMLRSKFGTQPVLLLEKFRQLDDPFSVFLHGDYNRNNVLFRYPSNEGNENPIDLRMIDFQEVRYGSPAIDLSFYLFCNNEPSNLPHSWDRMVKLYHETVMETLCDIVGCNRDDDILAPYRFEKFIEHYTKYAFYGVMISIHFTPWMASPEDECNKLADLWTNNMKSKEFEDFYYAIGGDKITERIFRIIQFASEHGYMREALTF